MYAFGVTRPFPPADRIGLAAVLAGLLGCMTIGCSSPARSASMWIIEPSAIFVDTVGVSPYAFSNHVNLSGAANETVSFRFAIRVGAAAIARPNLVVGTLESANGILPPSSVSIFRLHPVSIERFPGWHIALIPPAQRVKRPMDVLVPLSAPRGGLPSTLMAGETYFFWVDVDIPTTADAGIYQSAINLTSGTAPVASLKTELEVFPFALPGSNDIPVLAELDHRKLFEHHVGDRDKPFVLDADDWRESSRRKDCDALLLSTMRLLRRHRLTPVLPNLTPRVAVDRHRRMSIDWQHFDAVVAPYLTGLAFPNRAALELWPLPIHPLVSAAISRGHSPSPASNAVLQTYLKQTAKHFDDMGWLAKSYALLPTAGGNFDGVTAVRQLSKLARSADQRIAVVARLWPQDMEPYGWSGYQETNFAVGTAGNALDVDVWLPPGQFYDSDAMANQRAAGRRTWMAIDRPPFTGSLALHAPAGYARVLGWQGRAIGASALYAGQINAWPTVGESATPIDCVRVDPSVLLYPGTPFGLDRPVATARLKELRRGMQDAAYLRLLSASGLEHIAATLRRSIAPLAGTDVYRTHFADGGNIGWVQDPALFDQARDIMAQALKDSLGGRRTANRSEQFVADTKWHRFMLAARRVRLAADGTRVRLTGNRAAWEAEVTYAVTIVNRKRTPLSGFIQLTHLPSGWSVGERVAVTSIPPNGSRNVAITAHTAIPPFDSRALRENPTFTTIPSIELTTADGGVYQSPARVAFAAALRMAEVPAGKTGATSGLPRYIQIDGDLSDWPPGSVNVMRGFRLIAGSAAEGSNSDARRPVHATNGFVMTDDKYLYLAINCEADAPTLRAGRLEHRNRVEYEDMIPTGGGELIEILIDPLNSGTRSPGDLYHIAVKPSGTYLAEHGVRFDPPCGRSEPWPVDLEVATARRADRWMVELRVPLDAFDAIATKHAVWGFNITRFDAANQEFSTWSGATGNAYDPLSLGNLYLP